jgi:hypothetical protein
VREIPAAVRALALRPFWEIPPIPGFRTVERPEFSVILHPLPVAQVAEPRDLGAAEVESAVRQVRALVRQHGRDEVVWMVGPSHRWIGEALERLGLANRDTAGYESVEHAMALVEPPPSLEIAPDVEIVPVISFEQFAAAEQVSAKAFGFWEQRRAEIEADMEAGYASHAAPGNPLRRLSALIDGQLVGTADYALTPAGINLFGGAVLPQARGRGVYRALTAARWQAAIANGTPALTIQAGRMSRPIAERLGFQVIDSITVYVDDLGA